MRDLRRLGWAAAVAAAVAGPAAAQQVGGGAQPGGSATISPNGNVLTATASGGGGNAGGSTTSSSGSGSSSGDSTTELPLFEAAPQIGRPSVTQTGTPNRNVNASNFLANYYANPYYQGRAGIGSAHVNPGGFAAALYTVTGTSGTTGTTGRAGMAGRGGAGGALSSANVGGVLAQARPIAYPAVVRFQAPPVVPAGVQADLRGVIDRTPTSMLANPAGVQVQVDGSTVVLRGAVRDEDEARMVAGMARLTPGVRDVRNELTYPRQ